MTVSVKLMRLFLLTLSLGAPLGCMSINYKSRISARKEPTMKLVFNDARIWLILSEHKRKRREVDVSRYDLETRVNCFHGSNCYIAMSRNIFVNAQEPVKRTIRICKAYKREQVLAHDCQTLSIPAKNTTQPATRSAPSHPMDTTAVTHHLNFLITNVTHPVDDNMSSSVSNVHVAAQVPMTIKVKRAQVHNVRWHQDRPHQCMRPPYIKQSNQPDDALPQENNDPAKKIRLTEFIPTLSTVKLRMGAGATLAQLLPSRSRCQRIEDKSKVDDFLTVKIGVVAVRLDANALHELTTKARRKSRPVGARNNTLWTVALSVTDGPSTLANNAVNNLSIFKSHSEESVK
ncbi:hypothetical protein BU15DRAFT_61261 [Melanogaster broomeanus]|nr:hypothetical protein BU15DRAFT_61261 [Melanogaster broomeanus]